MFQNKTTKKKFIKRLLRFARNDVRGGSVQRIHQHKITVGQNSLLNFTEAVRILVAQLGEHLFIHCIQQLEK